MGERQLMNQCGLIFGSSGPPTNQTKPLPPTSFIMLPCHSSSLSMFMSFHFSALLFFMALVPFHGPTSIQRLLVPLFKADRVLHELHQTVFTLIDLEDDLEDFGLRESIRPLQIILRHMQLLITQLKVYKLQLMCQLVRHLHLHHRAHGRVLVADLEYE